MAPEQFNNERHLDEKVGLHMALPKIEQCCSAGREAEVLMQYQQAGSMPSLSSLQRGILQMTSQEASHHRMAHVCRARRLIQTANDRTKW